MWNYIVFFIVVLINGSFGWEISSATSDSELCAEIFFQDHYQGKSFYLKDSEHISELGKIHDQLGSSDDKSIHTNVTYSFKIRPGCSLITTDRSKLKGNVNEFDKDTEMIPLNQKIPQSAACSCPKTCQCEDAVLRQRECARAYLMKDCSHCDAYFTSMTHRGSKKPFPDKWSGDVASLFVKKGCNLTLDVLDHDRVTIAADTTNNKIEAWNSTITSYECSCDPSVIFKRVVVPPNPNDPPSIGLPKTKREMLTMLNQESLKEHPGILAALQSVKNGRSPTNAYILVLGLTGAGKSSAINLLFDNPNITRVGGMVSTTTDIHEFRMRVRMNDLGLNNTELRVIDTPGIADTRGIQQDAKFLATLDEFLQHHEDLKDRLPNVVLIFSKFQDNRYEGDGSGFVKMLRTIDLFKNRIIDPKYSNVIFVLSHYMSETKTIQRDPTEKLEKIRKVIEEFSTIPKPINIVVAENKAAEAHLPSLNGYYQLPNGDFYPKNLFDQIQRTLITSGDPLGESVIRTGFKNSDNFRIVGKHFRLVPDTDPEVTKYLGVLSSLDTPADSTEIGLALSESYQDRLDPELVKKYPGIFSTLSRFFFQRNINEISSLPTTTVEILKLFQDIVINPASVFLLQDALNLNIPTFKGDLLVGSSYDLLKDKSLPTPIFDLSDFEPSEIGFEIPKGFNIMLQNRMESTFSVLTSRDAYVATRISNLNIETASVPSGTFTGEIKDGFNIVSSDETSNVLLESGKFSALLEYQMFQMRLGKDVKKFSPELISTLEGLRPFNQSEWDNVENWARFFNLYGTHVIVAASGGGSITIKLAIEQNYEATLSKTQQYAILTDSMSRIVQHFADSLKGIDSILDMSNDKVSYELIVSGGQQYKAREDFDIDLWKESVYYNPVMLTTYLELVPISDLVRQSNYDEIATMIEEAAGALFNASLVYVPVSKVNFNPATSRDRTGAGGDGFSSNGGDYRMVQEFAGIFKMMSAETDKMYDKMMLMMAQVREESEKRSELAEQQRKLDKEIEQQEKAILREEARLKEERDLQREALHLQNLQNMENLRIEKDKVAMQMQQQSMMAMAEAQAQQQQLLMQYINSENQRIHEASLAAAAKKPIWESITGTITQAVGPLALLFAG